MLKFRILNVKCCKTVNVVSLYIYITYLWFYEVHFKKRLACTKKWINFILYFFLVIKKNTSNLRKRTLKL